MVIDADDRDVDHVGRSFQRRDGFAEAPRPADGDLAKLPRLQGVGGVHDGVGAGERGGESGACAQVNAGAAARGDRVVAEAGQRGHHLPTEIARAARDHDSHVPDRDTSACLACQQVNAAGTGQGPN